MILHSKGVLNMLLQDILSVIRDTDVDICQYQDGVIKIITSVPKDIDIKDYIIALELYGDMIVQFMYVSNDCITIIIK